MSKQLIERLRRGREVRIEIDKPSGEGKFVFIALRPSDLDMVGVQGLDKQTQTKRGLGFVVGWENVVEDDIVGGACMDPVKFDPELWMSWISDRAEYWGPIGDAIFSAFFAHLGAEADAAKN